MREPITTTHGSPTDLADRRLTPCLGPAPRQIQGRAGGLATIAIGLLLTACAPSTYPSLITVPPRPTPSASLAEREALGRALRQDGDAAQSRGATLGIEPPQQPGQAPAAPVVVRRAPPARKGPPLDTAAEDYVAAEMLRARDDAELEDLLRQLDRPVPGGSPSATAARALGLQDDPEP